MSMPRRIHRKHPTSGDTIKSSSKLCANDDDQVLSSWDLVANVPPFEVNSLAAPIGQFWDHMRDFAFGQAAREFPWHLNWNRQCP